MALAAELADGDLLAGALGPADPGTGFGVLLGRTGAGRCRGLAIVLAGLGNAVALLDAALGLGGGAEQQRGAERGSDGERCGLHGELLRGVVSLAGVRTMRRSRHGLKYRVPMGSMRGRYEGTIPDAGSVP